MQRTVQWLVGMFRILPFFKGSRDSVEELERRKLAKDRKGEPYFCAKFAILHSFVLWFYSIHHLFLLASFAVVAT